VTLLKKTCGIIKKSFLKKSHLFMKKKAHLTKDGLTQIVEILYNVPNNYIKSKESWLELIKEIKFKN